MQIWQAVMACNLRSTNSDSIVWTISTVQQQLVIFFSWTYWTGRPDHRCIPWESLFISHNSPWWLYNFFTDCTPYSDCNNLYEKITSFWLAENECILI